MIRFYSWAILCRCLCGRCIRGAAGRSAFLGYSVWIFDQVPLLHAGD
jgi:hypothetical protein